MSIDVLNADTLLKPNPIPIQYQANRKIGYALNAKKVYYSVTYSTCPNCHTPLALYSETAKRIAEQQEKYGSSKENIAKKFGLEDLDEVDMRSANWINQELFGNGLIEFASIFSGAKNSELVVMSCLRALVEQNWILTRQLNKINRQLEEIVKSVHSNTQDK